jgi:hypothetical protein
VTVVCHAAASSVRTTSRARSGARQAVLWGFRSDVARVLDRATRVADATYTGIGADGDDAR